MSAERLAARAALLAHLDTATPQGGLSDAGFAELEVLVKTLRPTTLYAAPAETPRQLAGRWDTLFAHFGAAHSANKPRVHDSSLKAHSFSKFPDRPIRVSRICQEVTADGSGYNNIVSIAAPNGSSQGLIITRGRWRADPENKSRLHVDFYDLELRPLGGQSDAAWREALGLPADQPLSVEFKPPRLWSDVVYLDDDLRLNVGSFGGLYVLTKLNEAAISL